MQSEAFVYVRWERERERITEIVMGKRVGRGKFISFVLKSFILTMISEETKKQKAFYSNIF